MTSPLDLFYEASLDAEQASLHSLSPQKPYLSPASSASSFSLPSVTEGSKKPWSPQSSRSSFSLTGYQRTAPQPFHSVLMSTSNVKNNWVASNQLIRVLRSYIIHRCSLNEYCCEVDFDATALDALFKMPFLQAMQTVEHFSSSVSSRIQKKSAYLMGILRGQETHWDKFVSTMEPQHRARDILQLPAQFLLYLGNCCLSGHCLPSDFTPEVVLSLHPLEFNLAVKAISAFNTNKRIIAGAKGGVINRPRFFLRLIQNVAEQADTRSPTQRGLNCSPSSISTPTTHASKGSIQYRSLNKESELNLEQLAELNFEDKPCSQRIKELEEELRRRDLREKQLVHELQVAQKRLARLQNECIGLTKLLNGNQTQRHY